MPTPRPGSEAGRDIALREDAERREHAWLSPLACFSDVSADRPVPEAPDEFRPAFVRDRDRIVHCGAFRRLKDKTQVFVIDEGDFYRTRLTHTLEVAQMARSLCLALRLNESLGEALALVHDIGHPPFGHEGERILDDRCGVPFDHNRQALRIIDVLESPYPEREGLNLTHALRRSILKHGGDAGRGAPVSAGLLLEAQCVDLADSTAYQHHDLEDGLRAGILREEELAELDIWRQAASELREEREAGGGDGASAAARGKGEPQPERVPGAAAAGLAPALPRKAVLSRLVHTSLHDIVAQSARNLSACGARDAEEVAAQPGRLVRMSPARASQHRQLATFLLERFYRHPRVLRSAATAREAIAMIVAHYQAHAEQLPADYRRRVERDGLPRSVCDYVAGMTDRYAMDEWRRLAAARSTIALHVPDLADEERIAALERMLGYVFHDKRLAAMALTHASARSEARFPNERLEFLGDSVLGVCVAQDLYHRYPDREEGELSRIKSAVVSRHALSRVAEHWGLDALLTLGPGIRTSGQTPASVVADAVEAVLGAVFVDGDLPPVRRIIGSDFAALIEGASDRQRSSNHKSDLQHFTQGSLGRAPHYQVLAEAGPDHE
ncbi:MAG TPA: dNTP triphosphohydrolase, partial [Planctomycetota bacterium]|nr:dNTP triphosphohydrolase [Planctomycetota bacterium]